MSERIRLRVLGLSYSQLQNGAYALILAEADGPGRIPVVIGPAEAQSIALRLESIVPPRPMTHDLFVSFAHAFGVKLKEVFIYKFEDGIFSSELTFTDGDRTVVIDSRTSDAIAIAMRTHAPIYTTPEILDETGFLMETHGDDTDDTDDSEETQQSGNVRRMSGFDLPADVETEPRYENYTMEELERTLQRLIDNENYEEAARVAEILRNKKND